MRNCKLLKHLERMSLQALLVTFANAKPCTRPITGFVIESSYKSSKYSPQELTNEIYQLNNQLLSDFTKLNFQLNGTKHQYFIESELSCDDFFFKIYQQIQRKRIESNINDNDFSKLIILAFFGLRGSYDGSNLYAMDLPRQVLSVNYLDNLFKLLTNVSDLRQLNLNFRELQEQFVAGKNKRNTQFRINLRYFYDNFIEDLKVINIFKYEILKSQEKIILSQNISQKPKDGFIERLFFYRDNILNKTKTQNEIEQLRKNLGFIYDEVIDEKVSRNQGIVQYVRAYFPDECACCKNHYPIENRTFKYRNSERWYLEIHHIISFSADRTLDQIDNLVKLCPTCHRALTKNRADEAYQKSLISEIFINNPKAKEFCLNLTSDDNCIQFVYDRLR